jgi:hypothetical protein
MGAMDRRRGIGGIDRTSLQETALHVKLIHPVAGIVAEFSSAYEMMDYFMRKGGRDVPEGAELKGLIFQVSEGGLVFQELVDRAMPEVARDGLLCMHSEFQLQ